MHRIFRVKAYEKEHGPHFNEEYARKAVMKMENEDGTRGPHWSLEETTTLASQYGIALGSKFNRYDKIDALREKNSTLISQLSNEHQTAAVGTMINQATAPIVTRLNTLQSDVDGIKCKLPNTVSVPYPQLSVYNPEIFRAAAYGAFAGDTYANYGLSSQCGC